MNMESDTKKTDRMFHPGYCWVVLLLVGFAAFFTFFHRMSASVIRTDLTETFALSATSFATFSSVCFYPYMLMQLPVGLLADRWGVRKTVSAGCFVTALGTLLFSVSGSFTVACVGRALVGLGISTPVVCTQKTAATWFPENRVATASALAGTIGNFGGLCAQTPLALLAGYLGWRATFTSAGAVTLLFAILCAVFLRDQPVGAQGGTVSKRAEDRERAKEPLTVTLKKIFRNPRIVILLVVMFVQMGIYQMFSGTWGISYLSDVFGYTNLEASGFTSWMMVGMMTFYLLIPVISDQIKRRKLLLVGISAVTFGVWLLISYGSPYLQNRYLLIGLMVLMGATSSSFPLMFSLIREYCDPASVGTAVGSCNMIGMAAGAVFPIFCGKIIDYFAESGISSAALYGRAFTFAVILAGIALAASVMTTETNCHNIFEEK